MTDALHNLNAFVTTPGVDKFSRRGCDLMNKYLLEADLRGLACIQLAYKPEVERQYGMDVVNDLLTRAANVVRSANRLYSITALLETNYEHPQTLDPATIEGFRHVVSLQLPEIVMQLAQMTRLARAIMLTVEVKS